MPARLTKVLMAKKIAAPTAVAWEAIRGIGRLDIWFPTIASCRVEGDGVGAHRHLTLHRDREMTDRGTNLLMGWRCCVDRRFRIRGKGQRNSCAYGLKARIGAGIDGMEEDLRRAFPSGMLPPE